MSGFPLFQFQEMIWERPNVCCVWTGGGDFQTENDFKWVAFGRNITMYYSGWLRGEPNGSDQENCLEIWSGRLQKINWNDKNCDTPLNYVCMFWMFWNVLRPQNDVTENHKLVSTKMVIELGPVGLLVDSWPITALMIEVFVFLVIMIDSLLPSNAIWQHGSNSTLAQVMADFPMAPSFYMNQYWFPSKVLCGLHPGAMSQEGLTNLYPEIILLKFLSHISESQDIILSNRQ